MSPFAQAILATLLVSAISLAGVIFFFADWSERLEVLCLSFAAGVLLGTTFFQLLPEAVEQNRGGNVFVATLAAIATFFVLERFLHGFHDHEDGKAMLSRYLILIGDSVHNFADGVAIAAGFLLGPAVGIATALAVAAHEIPHEVADYAVLVSGGFGRRRALLLNFLTGLSALLGALACFTIGNFVHQHLSYFMAASAGMFIYIAAADLIPELHHSRLRNSWLCTVPFFAGMALMALLVAVIPESR